MKKFLVLLFVFSLLFIGGCKKGPKTTPQDDLSIFLEAFKTQNPELLKEYSLNGEDFGIHKDSFTPPASSFLDLMTDIDYKIKEVTKEKDHQVVFVELEHVQFQDAFLYITDVLTQKAIEFALQQIDDPPLNQEEMEQKSNSIIEAEVQSILAKKSFRTTETVPIIMVPTEDKWKVDMDRSEKFKKACMPDETVLPTGKTNLENSLPPS